MFYLTSGKYPTKCGAFWMRYHTGRRTTLIRPMKLRSGSKTASYASIVLPMGTEGTAAIIIEKIYKLPVFSWGAVQLSGEGDVRAAYLRAVKAVDNGDYSQLLAFSRS